MTQVICGLCDQPFTFGEGCYQPIARVENIEYYRRPSNPEYRDSGNCSDCGTPIGGYHHAFCSYDDCPRCLGQAMACGCRWDISGPENEEAPGARRVHP